MPSMTPGETHRSARVGWLRAAVLGANDGIVSTASVVVGVASSGAGPGAVLIAGIASLTAGALSMAAGEYVSVSSQADLEQADLDIERQELAQSPEAEEAELADIYRGRGLPDDLAREVARTLMAHDALGAHARDELGLTEVTAARPLQAAVASAASFAVGAILPVVIAAVADPSRVEILVSAASIASLAALGALAARAGGASMVTGAVRVSVWGAFAMAATAAVGWLFGTVVT